MEALGVECPPQEALHRYIGPPLHGTFRELLGGEERVTDAINHYRERFSTAGMYENAVYPGIPQALDALSASGARLYLATSKPRVFAVRILEHFGLHRYFSGIHGSELDGTLAGKAALIEHILRGESLAADRCVMVGDRLQDVEGAKANGVFPAGVLWGYGSRQELLDAGAGILLERPEELSMQRLSNLIRD